MRRILVSCALVLAGCAGEGLGGDAGPDSGPVIEPRADYAAPGPHPVGNVRIAAMGERALPVELWYPAAEEREEQSLAAFEAGGENEAAMEELLDAAPDCVRRTTRSGASPPAVSAPEALPAIVFSHCHGCVRFDMAAVAERLASHGIVVAAPDHLGNTLWDARAGMLEPVGEAFLRVRASDVSSVLDRLLDGDAEEMPSELRGRIDPARVGVMGHSFGAATTGLVVKNDPRFVAAMAVAAPAAVLGGVRIEELDVPYLWLVAREDHSVGEVGNQLMRAEHRRIATPSWRVEIDDAGHWSFSDILGLDAAFTAGCGDDTRQLGGEPFTYLDPDVARDLASSTAAAFFAIHLLDDPGAATALRRLNAPPISVQ